MKKVILFAACVLALSGLLITSNAPVKSADLVPPIQGASTTL